MARSPLVLGANLTRLDETTRALITNQDVIALDQHSHDNHPVDRLPPGFEHARVWVASGKNGQRYIAVFNLDSQPASLDAAWDKLGLAQGKHAVRDLWTGQLLAASDRLKVVLPTHGCVLYAVDLR